ncbi:MAG: malonyl-ACP O-methyltransferase BioC [Tannerellaceae bacterium]|jgi:malonyl-ACP O-methyltransferase BioC|nr:malonyl-ACP O-methyltransferase BioC [Tannerellaceae bacterium]
MDKQLIKSRFSKAATSYDKAAIVQRQIAERMILLMKETIPLECRNLLEIGCGTGIFSRLLIRHIQPERMIMNDICPEMEMNVIDIMNGNNIFMCGDAEMFSFPRKIDIIASCSTIQWFENLPSFFKRCHASLNESGFLVFSTFGKNNMKEISSLTGTGLSYHSKSELEKELLSLNYDIVYSGEELINKSFNNPIDVLHHLKRTGVTGIKEQFWTKGTVEAYCREYILRYSNGNSVSLTYHPIYIIAKKKTV